MASVVQENQPAYPHERRPLFPSNFDWKQEIYSMQHGSGHPLSRIGAVGKIFRDTGKTRMIAVEKDVAAYEGREQAVPDEVLGEWWGGVAAIAFGAVLPKLEQAPFQGYFDLNAAVSMFNLAIQGTRAWRWQPHEVYMIGGDAREVFTDRKFIDTEDAIIADNMLTAFVREMGLPLGYSGTLPNSVQSLLASEGISKGLLQEVVPEYLLHVIPALKEIAADDFPGRLQREGSFAKTIALADALTKSDKDLRIPKKPQQEDKTRVRNEGYRRVLDETAHLVGE